MAKPNITINSEPTLWILTDPHLLARNLHDYGLAFRQMEQTSAGKDLAFQEWRLQKLVDLALVKRPTAIIITGDLTFNGEYESARRLADIFAPLEPVGIPLLVVPGNHDINDGWARSFHGEDLNFSREISPTAWKNLFCASYQQAVSADPHSLAYSVNLNPDYRLLMLDSCLYQSFSNYDDPVTNGLIAKPELEWAEDQLQAGRAAGQRCLVFMHHNLYRHNQLIHRGFVLDNAAEVVPLLTEYQVPVVFAGHIHAQNILQPNEQGAPAEIITSAFGMTDQGYGVVKLGPESLTYQRHQFAPSEQAFAAYLRRIFVQRVQTQFLAKIDRQEVDPQLWQAGAELLANLHWAYFTGQNSFQQKEPHALEQSAAFQWLVKEQVVWPDYLLSLAQLAFQQDHWYLHLTY